MQGRSRGDGQAEDYLCSRNKWPGAYPAREFLSDIVFHFDTILLASCFYSFLAISLSSVTPE